MASTFRLKRKLFAAGYAVGNYKPQGNLSFAGAAPKPQINVPLHPQNQPTQGAMNVFNAGQRTVGIKQGAMNTWNRMGKMGKAGTVAAGLGGAYLIGKGLFGGKKR